MYGRVLVLLGDAVAEEDDAVVRLEEERLHQQQAQARFGSAARTEGAAGVRAVASTPVNAARVNKRTMRGNLVRKTSGWARGGLYASGRAERQLFNYAPVLVGIDRFSEAIRN